MRRQAVDLARPSDERGAASTAMMLSEPSLVMTTR